MVTELAYSPALAGSLGDYIRKLRDERSRRQIGIIFLLLALFVQLFATLFPPESANATDPSVFIDGGVQSIDNYLTYYDQNVGNIRDLLTSLGIVRSDVENTTLKTLPSTTDASLWTPQSSRAENSLSYFFQTSQEKQEVAYYQPLTSAPRVSEAYVGMSARSDSWFAIAKDTGNLITETKKNAADCTSWFYTSPALGTDDSWRNKVSCPSTLTPSLSARIIQPSSSATPHEVDASDRIAYTLSLTNKGDDDALVKPAINLEDVLEYSRILDNGGSDYSYDTKMLSWPTTTLAAGESMERSFIVQILPTIPSTARGQYVTASYDCTLKASFGSTITTAVNCPFAKSVEHITYHLPRMSQKANLMFAAGLLLITLYLYFRAKQLLAELYVIRHIHLGGM